MRDYVYNSVQVSGLRRDVAASSAQAGVGFQVSAKEAWGKEQGARELGVGWVEPVPGVMGFALSITFLCLPGYSKLTMKAIPTE